MPRRLPRCTATALAIVVASIIQLGCVPPVPLRTKHRTISGNTDVQLDLTQIKPGVTTRDQVMKGFGDMQYSRLPSRYWGRYQQSTWSDPGGSRSWVSKNLLIAFDDHEVVRSSVVISDSELSRQFCNWIESDPTVRPSVPVSMSLEGWLPRKLIRHRATVTVDDQEIRIKDQGQPDTSFNAPIRNIKLYRSEPLFGSAKGIELSLVVVDPSQQERKITVEMDIDRLMDWLERLRKSGAGTACR